MPNQRLLEKPGTPPGGATFFCKAQDRLPPEPRGVAEKGYVLALKHARRDDKRAYCALWLVLYTRMDPQGRCAPEGGFQGFTWSVLMRDSILKHAPVRWTAGDLSVCNFLKKL